MLSRRRASLALSTLVLLTACGQQDKGGSGRIEVTDLGRVPLPVVDLALGERWLAWSTHKGPADQTTRGTMNLVVAQSRDGRIERHLRAHGQGDANLSAISGDHVLVREIQPVLGDCASQSGCFTWTLRLYDLRGDRDGRIVARAAQPGPQSENPIIVGGDAGFAWQERQGPDIVTRAMTAAEASPMTVASIGGATQLSIDRSSLCFDTANDSKTDLHRFNFTTRQLASEPLPYNSELPWCNRGRLVAVVPGSPGRVLAGDNATRLKQVFIGPDVFEAMPLGSQTLVWGFDGLHIVTPGSSEAARNIETSARVAVYDGSYVYAIRNDDQASARIEVHS